MKRSLVIVALAIAGVLFILGQTEGKNVASLVLAQTGSEKTTPNNIADQELRRLDAEYFQGYLSMRQGRLRDVTTFERILADDYFSIGGDGIVGNKAQRLALVRDPERTTESNHSNDVQVRVYGDTAVVHSRFTFTGTYKGKKISGLSRDIHWYIKRQGRWWQVAGIGVPITPQPAAQTSVMAATTQVTAQRAFDAFKHSIETGEVGPFLALVADDVAFSIGRENGWEGEKKGKAALIEHTDWRWNEIKLRSPVFLERTTVSGNTAIFEFRLDGTVQDSKPFKKNVVILFDVQGNKISGFREYTG